MTVYEKYSGGDLSNYLRRRYQAEERLDGGEVLNYFTQILMGIEYIHYV